MGMVAYFTQGCARSFYGRARRSKRSNPWSSLSVMTLQFNWLNVQILCVDYLAAELFHTCLSLSFFLGWNCPGKTVDQVKLKPE